MRFGGIVDRDGHVFEPPYLYKKTRESHYKDGAIYIRMDPGETFHRLDGFFESSVLTGASEGWESLVIDGQLSPTIRGRPNRKHESLRRGRNRPTHNLRRR